MSVLISTFRRLLTGEDGPTAVEYAVLVGLIVVGTIAAVSALSSSISGTFSTTSSAIGS